MAVELSWQHRYVNPVLVCDQSSCGSVITSLYV